MPHYDREFKDYLIVLHLKGFKEPLSFPVDPKEADRLKCLLDEIRLPQPLKPFFCINTLDHRSLAISTHDILAVRYLWNPVEHNLINPLPENCDPIRLRFHFRNVPEPLEADSESPEELANLVCALDGYSTGDIPFVTFPDEDAEDATIGLEHLVLFECSLSQLTEGHRLQEEAFGTEDTEYF